jgi:hypothetical protein
MNDDTARRERVPMEERTPVGFKVGECKFPYDANGRTCGNPVYAKSEYGRKPQYCGKVVNGTLHDGKNAAKARDALGLKADKPAHTTRTTAPAAAPSFVTATPADQPVEEDLIPQLAESIATISTAQTVSSSEVQQPEVAAAPAEEKKAGTGEPVVPVTEHLNRVAKLVSAFEQIGQQIATASEVLAPQIVAALEAAGAAGAAEDEIIEATTQVNEKLALAQAARTSAEQSAREHADKRREMAVERDRAVAEAKRVREESAAAVAAAKAEAEQAREAAKAAEETAAAAVANAEEQITAAREAQARAEGEVEELRRQVTKLGEQLDRERQEHRDELDRRDERDEKREQQHQTSIRETEQYWKDRYEEMREMFNQAQKMNLSILEAQGRRPDENASTSTASEG